MDAMVGRRFGALIVAGRSGVRFPYAACVCDCGRTASFPVRALLAGDALDCRPCERIRNGWSSYSWAGRGEAYVVAARGLFKIGWSDDVARRAGEIGRACGAPAVAILRVPGAEHETLLHRLCFDSHERREWFRSDERTRSLIADLALLPLADRGERVRALYHERYSEPGSVARLRRFAGSAWRDVPVTQAA